jgi:hypothetical protein
MLVPGTGVMSIAETLLRKRLSAVSDAAVISHPNIVRNVDSASMLPCS